jgi:hypothetical protein
MSDAYNNPTRITMKKALFLTFVIAVAGLVVANTTVGSVEAQAPAAAGENATSDEAATAEADAEVDESTDEGWIESWTGIKAFGSGKCSGKSHGHGDGSCAGKSSEDGQCTEPTLDSDQEV